MSKHTPGPWKVELLDEGHQIRMGSALLQNGRCEVHHTVMYEHGLLAQYDDGTPVSDRKLEQFNEAEANARLIAAAPDLLEACKRIAQLKITTGDDEAFTQLHAAIAKAEGGCA